MWRVGKSTCSTIAKKPHAVACRSHNSLSGGPNDDCAMTIRLVQRHIGDLQQGPVDTIFRLAEVLRGLAHINTCKELSRLCALSLFLIAMCMVVWPAQVSAQASDFDFAKGNAALRIIQPQVVDAARTDYSPTGSDPSFLLRIFVTNSNGWYDAIAPYHPTAVGVYSRLGRRPASESADNTQMNIAMLYASHKVLPHLFPDRTAQWDKMLRDLGLDPNDISEDLNTAIGIGNAAGRLVVEGRAHDGMNALGDEGGHRSNLLPYSDYTGYEPVNTAYELVDPSRWQPQMVKVRGGTYQIQQFVTPQYQFVEPYTYRDPHEFDMPEPISSNYKNKELYTAQAQDILDESAKLDDRKKMLAEYFNDKIASLGGSGFFASRRAKLGLFDFVAANFFTNAATYDAGILAWQEKVKYDAVRPVTAIHLLFKGKTVRAYIGPKSGQAGEIVGEEWNSYLPVADHPEYPSGSACFCAAHSEFKRKYFGSDDLNMTVSFAAGSSKIEQGLTPKSDLKVTFATWTEFEQICGQSRIWAGVHFRPSVEQGLKSCRVFGDLGYDYMRGLIAGTASPRSPSRSTMK